MFRRMNRLLRWPCQLLVCGAMAIPASSVVAQEPGEKPAEHATNPLPMTASPAERIAHALNEQATLQFTNASLAEFADWLSKTVGVDVVIRRRALAEEGMDEDLEINFDLADVPLGVGLRQLLEAHELTWIEHGDAMEITTKGDAVRMYPTRAYNVRSIAADPHDPEVIDVDSLIAAITSSFNVESWEDVGGPNTLRPFDGTLVVCCDEETHRGIESLLAAASQLKKRLADSKGEAIVESLPLSVGKGDLAIRERVSTQRVSYDLEEAPLASVADFFSTLTTLPIELDSQALEEYGIDADLPISGRAAEVSLSTAFDRLLDEHQLTWMVERGLVLITTTDAADATRVVRLYPVRDLLDTSINMDDGFAALQQLIIGLTMKETWQDVGGPGSIVGLRSLDALVIAQSEPVHAKIADLLAKLRVARRDELAAEATGDEGAATADERIAPITQIKVYRPAWGQFEPATARDLTTIIADFVAPESWAGENTLRVLGGSIVIRQTPANHQKVRQLFDTLAIPVTTAGRFPSPTMEGGLGGAGGGMMGGGMMGGAGGMGGGGGFFRLNPLERRQ